MSEQSSGLSARASSRWRARRDSGQRLTLLLAGLACVLCVAAWSDAASAQRATSARTLPLSESGHLRLTSKQGFTLNEQGSATGTIRGTIYIHLHLVSGRKVSAEVNIYPSHGSLSGTGTAGYQVNGAFASFSGALSITRGSGSYSRVRRSSLRFTGTIQRRTDAVTVQLSGPLSL